MKTHGVRYESPEAAAVATLEAGALTLFGLLPEPEPLPEPESIEAWLAALGRRAGKAAEAKARKARAAKLAKLLPVAA